MAKTGAWAVLSGVVAGTFLLGVGAFLVLKPGADAMAACRGGVVGGGDIGGPFTLLDETGATVTDTDVITAPTIVYFGYTFCPDICPMDVARNAVALEILEEDHGIEANGLFITIDPARDTVDVVREFTDLFHPRMLGLTGSEEQINAAKLEYRVYGQKDQSGDPDYYLVNHSTFSYLVLPETGFVEFFNRETTPEAMAETVACFSQAVA